MKTIQLLLTISLLLSIAACSGGGGKAGKDAVYYSIAYNSNDATDGDVPVEAKVFAAGQVVTVQGNPGGLVKNGYSFSGWNTLHNGNGSSFTQGSTFMIGSANVILYAQWTVNPVYTVTYDGNHNTAGAVPTDTSAYQQGQTVTVQGNDYGLARTGFNFTGWNTAPDGSGSTYSQSQEFTIGPANVVLYAMWTAVTVPTYKVTYNENVSFFDSFSGTAPVDTTNYEQNQTVTVLDNTGNLTRTGYAFSNWNTAGDGSGAAYNPGGSLTMGNADVTLYAIWVRTYTVTYNDNESTGGLVPADTAAYRQGETVTVTGNTGTLEKSGYTFAGWSVSPDGNGTTYLQDQQFIMGSENVTLYAKWILIPTYTVTYSGNGAEGGDAPVDTNNYQQGANVKVSGNTGILLKHGYSFSGWNTAADGGGVSYAQGQIFIMGQADVTLYAQWTAEPVFTVTYNGNGSDNVTVPLDSTGYLQDAEVTVLGNINGLVKAGYTFSGWNSSSDGKGPGYVQGDKFIMGNTDIILYAQWTQNPAFKVIYDGNGNTGGSVPIDSVNYEPARTVTVTGNTGNLSKDHFAFAGWNTKADGSGTSYQPGETFSMGDADVTLYAQWAAAYSITYNGNGNTGGTAPVDTNSYSPGQIAAVSGNTGSMIKAGSSFTGWNTAPDGSGTVYTTGNYIIMGAANIILYAQWTTNPTYTVTYNGNGNTEGTAPVDSTNYEDGQTFTVLGNTGGLVKTSYHFTGWNTSSDGSGTAYSQGQTADIATANVVLYAQWTSNPTYAITYSGNGNDSGTVPADLTNYEPGHTATVLDNTGNLAKSGHAFAGWNTMADGSGYGYTAGSTFYMGSSNVILYAQWIVAYTVTYNGNGNTGGTVPVDAGSYISGQTATVLVNSGLVKEGYNFTGWTLTPDGSGTVYAQGSSIEIISSDIIMYAKWSSNPTYNVIYNGNGNTAGTVPVDSTNYLSGQTATALPNSGNIVKTGYSFAGWNTAADGYGITYSAGETFIVDGTVVLYAKWAPAKKWYSITGSGDGTKLAAVVNNEYIYRSADSGATWTVVYNQARKWYSIAGSEDGTKLAAVPYNFKIAVSGDSGGKWTSTSSNKPWNSIAGSADGVKLAVTAYNGSIWTSVNSGTSWTEQTASGSRAWRSIASSTDGTKLAAVVSNGQIYTSVNSGVTWTPRAAVKNWYGITSSADGTKLAAVVNSGQIWVSDDSGMTWTAQASTKAWRAIAGSADGSVLAAVVNGGQIWISDDSGLTWNPRATSQAWISITCSSDGTKLAAAALNGQIYTSGDSGRTWTAR